MRYSAGRRPFPVLRILGLCGGVLLCFLWFAPLIWSVVASMRPPLESFSRGRVWFGSHLSLDNFARALAIAPFPLYFRNTIYLVTVILSVQLVTSSLAAFAFAFYRFPGKNVFFTIILAQMMIPTVALLVPNFQTIRILGLYDTVWAMAIPFWGSAFGTFLLRQAFLSIPRDYGDAALVDGCGWYLTLRLVYLPMATSSLVAFSISSINWHWNSLIWPLIVTQSDRTRPLTAGLARFTQLGEIGAQWGLMSAATLIVAMPLFLAFLVFQRKFLEGFMNSGLK
ncbi:carbohydrate ABC transporter membrane protein 2, CUT1 family [Alkalispirochaeta americana]|uniref:Carbohydrate ABC transporter membrane protein 2, CUT1 family n=1 Tax=Alkalispirochaeta americana TaxID=159291 RepID=A0A1N6NJF0_9SPIO|nr:carbohydrate ABC transporter permease [Alkalispirochaeta americana]SIP92173.1 carbohydrate ABC transporter membrane protein 2, CUT1 family [Alkalispirochaeta americana]